MITVYFNGEEKKIAQTTLAAFLAQFWQSTTCFAIAINQQFVARSNYANTALQHHDRIDLILPMQGG